MLGAQFAIHRQPILQGQETEHGRTIEVAGDDLLSQMGRQMFGCPTLFLEHRGIITLGAFRTLLPPQTERRHIMGRERSHTAVRIAIQMRELKAILLGHGLYLERQDTQVIQHMRDTIGQHAQILGTTEHLRLTDGSLETVDGILSPEEVMTLVEEVVVESHISILLLGSQRLIDGFLPGSDTGVVHLRLSGILHKQHIADEPVESITDPEAVLIVASLETGLHLPLGIVFLTEPIESVG